MKCSCDDPVFIRSWWCCAGSCGNHILTRLNRCATSVSANLTHSLTLSSPRYLYADFDIECHDILVWVSLFNPLPRDYSSLGFLLFLQPKTEWIRGCTYVLCWRLGSSLVGKVEVQTLCAEEFGQAYKYSYFGIAVMNIHKHVSVVHIHTWLEMFAPFSLRFLYFKVSGYWKWF
jgi:hypothetical protein